MKTWFVAALAFVIATGCSAQQDSDAADTPDLAADTASLPATDIYLGALTFQDGAPAISDLRLVVSNPGYDNQPSFLPGEAAFYFVSEGENAKTDIWRHDIDAGQSLLVYSSPAVSEYSPKAAPAGYGLSYIQENEAGDVTRVHVAPTIGGAGMAIVGFAPLGYYAWLDGGNSLGVFLRSEPPALHVVDVASGETREVAERIGRGLQSSSDGKGLYFTQAASEETHQLMFYNTSDQSISTLTLLPEGVQDYVVPPSNDGVLAGVGATLMVKRFDGKGNDWAPFADFTDQGLGDISRIAVSDDGAWIAFVAEAQ